jgi:hypothetical protein
MPALFFPNEPETAPKQTEFVEETKDEMWCRVWAEAQSAALQQSTNHREEAK